MSHPLTSSDPGQFELYCHDSPPTIYPEEAHSTVQSCVPLEGASYTARRQSETGTTLVQRLGVRDILVVPAGQCHAIDWRRPAGVVSIQASEAFIEKASEG